MNNLKTITIPQDHIDFAKEVAAIAKKRNIEFFDMKYHSGHEWSDSALCARQCFNKESRIIYRSEDLRGRPCENLSINITMDQSYYIVENQESSN